MTYGTIGIYKTEQGSSSELGGVGWLTPVQLLDKMIKPYKLFQEYQIVYTTEDDASNQANDVAYYPEVEQAVAGLHSNQQVSYSMLLSSKTFIFSNLNDL